MTTSLTDQSKSSFSTSSTTPVPKQYPRWHNVVAGAAAGAGARFMTAPLDLLRIRRQLASTTVSKKREHIWTALSRIAKSEGGVQSLFRGNVAGTYLWISYGAVQFVVYEHTSQFLKSSVSSASSTANASGIPVSPSVWTSSSSPTDWIGSNPTAVAFVSGATAGLAATLTTYPFDICRTIFAAKGLRDVQALSSLQMAAPESFHPPQSMMGFATDLFHRRGIKAFYAGSGVAAIQIVPYMGVNFAVYDYLVRWSESSHVGSAGMAGFVSGGLSKFLVYPLDTVKKRLQAQGARCSDKRYRGMADCFRTMIRQEGVESLYRGLVPSVIRNMAASGLTFAFFRFTKDALELVHDR